MSSSPPVWVDVLFVIWITLLHCHFIYKLIDYSLVHIHPKNSKKVISNVSKSKQETEMTRTADFIPSNNFISTQIAKLHPLQPTMSREVTEQSTSRRVTNIPLSIPPIQEETSKISHKTPTTDQEIQALVSSLQRFVISTNSSIGRPKSASFLCCFRHNPRCCGSITWQRTYGVRICLRIFAIVATILALVFAIEILGNMILEFFLTCLIKAFVDGKYQYLLALSLCPMLYYVCKMVFILSWQAMNCSYFLNCDGNGDIEQINDNIHLIGDQLHLSFARAETFDEMTGAPDILSFSSDNINKNSQTNSKEQNTKEKDKKRVKKVKKKEYADPVPDYFIGTCWRLWWFLSVLIATVNASIFLETYISIGTVFLAFLTRYIAISGIIWAGVYSLTTILLSMWSKCETWYQVHDKNYMHFERSNFFMLQDGKDYEMSGTSRWSKCKQFMMIGCLCLGVSFALVGLIFTDGFVVFISWIFFTYYFMNLYMSSKPYGLCALLRNEIPPPGMQYYAHKKLHDNIKSGNLVFDNDLQNTVTRFRAKTHDPKLPMNAFTVSIDNIDSDKEEEKKDDHVIIAQPTNKATAFNNKEDDSVVNIVNSKLMNADKRKRKQSAQENATTATFYLVLLQRYVHFEYKYEDLEGDIIRKRFKEKRVARKEMRELHKTQERRDSNEDINKSQSPETKDEIDLELSKMWAKMDNSTEYRIVDWRFTCHERIEFNKQSLQVFCSNYKKYWLNVYRPFDEYDMSSSVSRNMVMSGYQWTKPIVDCKCFKKKPKEHVTVSNKEWAFYRISRICAHMLDNLCSFSMALFAIIVFFALMYFSLYTNGELNGDVDHNIVWNNKSAYLNSEKYDNAQWYPICSKEWAGIDENTTLSTLDMLAISLMVYEMDDYNLTQMIDVYFDGNYELVKSEYDYPKWFHIRHKSKNVDIVSIRGTESFVEILQDLSLFFDVATWQCLQWVFPVLSAFPNWATREIIYYASLPEGIINADARSRFDESIYKYVQPYIDGKYGDTVNEESYLYLVGHSLGGSIASVIASTLFEEGYPVRIQSFSINSPGTRLSSMKFGYEFKSLDLTSVAVQRNRDLVSKIDQHGGITQEIECADEDWACHSLHYLMIEMMENCPRNERHPEMWYCFYDGSHEWFGICMNVTEYDHEYQG